MTHHIGIIGCGKQAEKHINGFRQNGVEKFTVCDLSMDLARDFAKQMNVEVVADTKALLELADLTAVDICTPTPSHVPLIKQAIEAGKHYLVEKPLASNLAEAREIEALTQKENLIGAVGFTYRFAPDFVALKDLFQQGAIGDVFSSTLRIGGRGSHATWKHRKATGGGAIREMLVHMIDLAVWYFGEMETIELVSVDQHYKTRKINGIEEEVDAEDYALAKLVSKSGQIVTLVSDFITPSFVQYGEFQGTEGTAFGSIQPHFAPFYWRMSEKEGFERGQTRLEIEGRNIVADLTGNFLDALDGKAAVRCSISDAVEVQRVLDTILDQMEA